MKKLYSIILLSFIIFAVDAQDFGAIGSTWYFNENGAGASPEGEYIEYKSVADTVVAGKNVHKITQTYYRYTGKVEHLDNLFVYQKGDTAYMYSPKRDRFLPLYVFNRKKGDEVTLPQLDYTYNPGSDTTYTLRIDSVKQQLVDGISLNHYFSSCIKGSSTMTGGYMDRIGYIAWFYNRGPVIPEAGGPIRCYKDAVVDTHFTTTPCTYTSTAISEHHKGLKDVTIYPNPVTTELNLVFQRDIQELWISNALGQLIHNQSKPNALVSVAVQSWPKGIYFLHLHTKQDEYLFKKILVE